MATITKTMKENSGDAGSTVYATWTVSWTGTDYNLTSVGQTISIASPVFKAKYVQRSSSPEDGAKGYGSVNAGDYLYIGTYPYYKYIRISKIRAAGAMTSGTTYTINDGSESALPYVLTDANIKSIFNYHTAEISSVPIYIDGYNTFRSYARWQGSDVNDTEYSGNLTFSPIGTFYYQCPPALSSDPTMSKNTSTGYFAGLTTVSFSIPITYSQSGTTGTAKYGGYIKKIEVSIGTQVETLSFDASSKPTSTQTISMLLANAGTFTPTITITDSRNQTATYPFSEITVNPYNVPSVSFDVYRTNDVGIKNDEGHYALIQSTISYTDEAATLTEPSIQIDGVDLSNLTDASVTWYKTWSNTNGVSNVISDWTTLVPQNHMVTIYGLIDWDYDTTGNFAEDTSYQITLVANDSLNGHSTPITQTMSTAFYTIDFQAGGKEIAFGAPANDDLTNIGGNDYSNEGLFKCRMHTLFEQDVNTNGNIEAVDVNASGDISANNITVSGDVTVGGHSSPIGTMQPVNVVTGALVANIDTYTSGASLTLDAGSYIIYCYGSMGTNSSATQLRAIRLYRVSPNAAGLWSWRNVYPNGNWATISATLPMKLEETTTLRVDASASVTANSASTWIIAMRIA